MRSKRVTLIVLMLMLGMAVAACAPAAPATEMPWLAAATEAPAAAVPTMALDAYAGAKGEAPAATAAANAGQPGGASQSFGPLSHMIVKNGDIRLLVGDADRALDGVTQLVTDTGGYVISSRVWYQDHFGTNYKYATLTLGVPVDQFEPALRRLRGLAVRVIDENASGEDVTSQYVDLQSELNNLQATRDRIKSFLDDAKSVDEALRINQQLSDVEVQIEKIKGQMNYLSNRSAFSTITINLEPQLPEVTMTPTPSPTPVPVQSLGPWDPSRTTQKATYTLISVYRGVVDMLIWVLMVLVPIFGPPILLIWLAVWLVRRKMKPAAKA